MKYKKKMFLKASIKKKKKSKMSRKKHKDRVKNQGNK